MDALVGLPDFGRSLIAADALAFAPFDAGACGVVPDSLTVATGADGAPCLTLDLLRRSDDLSDDGAYGVLDLALTGHYPLDATLEAAREDGDATVRALPIDLGFMRLVQAGDGAELGDLDAGAVPLGWSAVDGARWTQHLSPTTATLIAASLRRGQFPFGARLDFTIRGVAARAAAIVRCDPSHLLAGETCVSLEALRTKLAAPETAALITIDGAIPPGALPDLLLDRLFGAYGTLVPATDPSGPLTARFALPPPGDVTWDLSHPVVTSRAFLLKLNLTLPPGADGAALVRETEVPPLDVGFRAIEIVANLPAGRSGVPAIGVKLDMPANPPVRPSAVSETLIFAAPDDSGTLQLHLAPGEALSYHLTPFALLVAGRDVRQVEGEPVLHDESWLELQASDFPLRFARVSASAPLLAVANLSGTLNFEAGGAPVSVPVTIDTAHPSLALAMPEGAVGVLQLSARALDGSSSIDLPALPADGIALDLPSLPGYGPHRVVVTADFPGDAPSWAIDLVGADGSNPATVLLNPSSPSATWGYVAESPFRAGFRWRLQGGQWADAQGTTLALDAHGVAKLGSGDASDPPPIPAEIDQVRLFVDPDQPGTIRYLPAAPCATEDGGGHPAVNLIRTSQSVLVQVGAQFALPDTERNRIVRKLAIPVTALQPAPVEVRHVALLLTAQDGSEREIASSGSSGYPPFTAMLSATLQPDDGARAIGAINGAEGQLYVAYTLGLPGSAAPLVSRTDVASWFPGGTGSDHVQITTG